MFVETPDGISAVNMLPSSASQKTTTTTTTTCFSDSMALVKGSFRGYIRRWLVSPCEDDDDGIRRRVFKDDGVVGGEGLGMKKGFAEAFSQSVHPLVICMVGGGGNKLWKGLASLCRWTQLVS